MKNKIVLVGAGSTSFGPEMFNDIFLSNELAGSTIVLHDIDKKKLELIHELLSIENDKRENKFEIEHTTNRGNAFENADFIINSIEVGDRMKLWRQDYEIPRKYGSKQIMGECGGPGGSFHAWRIIPPIIDIIKDAEKICPNAFFINFSNPMSRVCLAIKRSVDKLKFVGLCHQIGFMIRFLPQMFKKPIKDLRMKVAGLNHFAFLMGLEDLSTGKDLMDNFNKNAMNFFKEKENRFEFSTLTFEIYKRFGYFPYVGDNHLGEYLQIGHEFTETQDCEDWIDFIEKEGAWVYRRLLRYYQRYKEGKKSRRRLLPKVPSGERAVPIIEAILKNKNSYEIAVNIPNNGIINNLPQDLVLECSGTIDKNGVHGIKMGDLPKNIATLLRIEASVQDLCVDAVLKGSKETAIACLAIDPNVGSFNRAESMFDEMVDVQKDYLPKFN